MSAFEIFKQMEEDGNEELKLSPISNIKNINTRKDGWGDVTIAIPNDIAIHLMKDADYYVGGFLLCKREEYEKYNKEE